MTFFGGCVLWVIAALALLSLVVWFERFVGLRRAQINVHDFMKGVINILDSGNDEEAIAICEDESAPAAAVVSAAIRNASGGPRKIKDSVDAEGRAYVGRLDRRLAALAIIAQVAPAIGLLGTVIGFVNVVCYVNSSPLVSRADLLNGAMGALSSTAAGLALAIATTVMYGSLRVRLERIIVEMEGAASQIVGYLSSRGKGA
ncbi:MAG: MotA/TolQ/ExbB proton channel family protein [Kiritimatiellae bacterium]|nr:MotA/TolQ/ExbB proton channel family protein [Kiritimatiellia bacterium]